MTLLYSDAETIADRKAIVIYLILFPFSHSANKFERKNVGPFLKVRGAKSQPCGGEGPPW